MFILSCLLLFSCLSTKLNDFLNFLKNIISIKPIENSNPAKANKKNDVLESNKSSLILPKITT